MPLTRRAPLVIRRTVAAAGTVALALLSSCSPGGTLRLPGTTPATAYERYAESLRRAGLDSTAMGREWLAAGDSALRAPLPVSLPLREAAAYQRTEARAVAWRATVRDGQRLDVRIEPADTAALLFADLFTVTGDTARPFRHAASAQQDSTSGAWQLTHEARRDGEVVLRLQPELLRSGRYVLIMRVSPSLAFPVEGRGNAAIQSLFGVARDGGRREHHGIDIFAPRGTPVLAATDGVVRSTRPNQLGGIVVWMWDDERQQSLYYAHLDRHVVNEGTRVQRGDTIGFVGNTGNAVTTAPHLHFGIYRRSAGPIDPLRHVRLETTPLPALAADTTSLGRPAVPRSNAAIVRTAPSAGATTVRRASPTDTAQLMGVNSSWYRVQFDDGVTGYLPASAMRFLDASASAAQDR
jgi:peptidoglycan LD-endopeptidase LytH